MTSKATVKIDLEGKLPKITSGKVRDLYGIDDDTLLFVATDRISAFDVIMENGIPGKGALLTAMSIYWFQYLSSKIPGLQTHFISKGIPSSLKSSLSSSQADDLDSRSMQVRRLRVFPVESIVRGYITGSGWAEYKRSGTVCGIQLPSGLIEGQKLEKPLWTPSTKAELGDHDENISPAKAAEILGQDFAKEIERQSLEVYSVGAQRAEEVGIVLADTKLEFGLDHKTNKVVLIDEVLTPDSSRFWPKETWEQNLGKAQPSFDKQFLRDWLAAHGLKNKQGVEMPDDVVARTAEQYRNAYEKITGKGSGA
ncbi:phosphoribosylaminoimidazole-succinocarboxamide synthase-like protein [Lophiostoma macrostomum CBS 122681]|uniref:Phosphoribosylaminoimidazole-succinocarboxamide synthase n=1 Tax=Lophiostoma macrostomum CBS 122681 TaxID=1314788 RepID=A0A6A6T1T2_9PLEO|nr:phosphoribosylaminoimidazole-succinocarboxamide synthase-like protein [Lophiostoma macrostomum CBS 122681]